MENFIKKIIVAYINSNQSITQSRFCYIYGFYSNETYNTLVHNNVCKSFIKLIFSKTEIEKLLLANK